jgi:hypothetical protein
MPDETEFLRPNEMQPEDWEHLDRTGLPPRRTESATGMKDALAASDWLHAVDPLTEAKAEAERERLEAMSPDDHLNDIQEKRWKPLKR